MKTNILLLVAVTCVLVSCSTQKSPGYNYSLTPRLQNGYATFGDELTSVDQSDSRVVIYEASLDMEPKNIDSANHALTNISKLYGGYILRLGTERSAIRVKSAQLQVAIADIEKLGTVSNKNITGQDMTEQYRDTEIRLENAQKARQRYLQLLEKAENVEAALKVEKELERINAEIDQLEGSLKKLSHLSDYSTIYVNMKEKPKPGILGYVGIGLYKGVKWLFVRN